MSNFIGIDTDDVRNQELIRRKAFDALAEKLAEDLEHQLVDTQKLLSDEEIKGIVESAKIMLIERIVYRAVKMILGEKP